MSLDVLLKTNPYSLKKTDKSPILAKELHMLTQYHYNNCQPYQRILKAFDFDPFDNIEHYEELLPLPVRLFKELTLKSIADDKIVKTMTSSGTSGQTVSKIYLDKYTALAQQNVGVKITAGFLEIPRMPLIIVDSPSILKSRTSYSARSAAVLFFSLFGRDKIFALDDDMNIDLAKIESFMNKHKGQPILYFGFTFIVWQHFYKPLADAGIKFTDTEGILIHSGGWKNMLSMRVSPQQFKYELAQVCGITRVQNEYGIAEQSGTIYFECEHDSFHASIFSDIVVRREKDLSVCNFGEPGIIELVSILPHSYPGHALLTEDEGVIIGEDDCPCGRMGKYFRVLGRIHNAELRGCSDTYEVSN